ncbi:Mitochondrial ATPase complex subunit atp10 [Dimargaris verticillata]|uniref:Mitochondrial ATPase complex subunit atp10 n=1 Tax=Dimargaris verticillata TaxID=2761393 RepID=A0A9W8B6F3_9FUNG|nr:Mitochondrial ATPase complex subunit atp10 [Dimargaris verticillata]
MKKPLPSGLRGRVIRNLPYTKSDVSPNREVARSLQDILQQVKQREASFKPGDPVGQPAPPVPQAPTSVVSALATRFKNLWDPDATLERRKYLIKKFHRSHFQDMVDIKNHGQKAFAASSKMIPAQKALYMPNLYAKSLDGRQRNLTTVLKDKVSLVSFEFTKLGGVCFTRVPQ